MIKSKYKITDNLYECECKKQFQKSQSLNAHFSFCLIHRNGKKAIDRFGSKRNWSKGLTKETDERVKCTSIKLSKVMLGKKLSVKTRNKISLAQIEYLKNNPHIKWFEVSNGEKIIKVQGKWEYNVARWLNSQNIKWDRKLLRYDNCRRYTPDFYLTDFDEYLEVKGWLRETDKEKMKRANDCRIAAEEVLNATYQLEMKLEKLRLGL